MTSVNPNALPRQVEEGLVWAKALWAGVLGVVIPFLTTALVIFGDSAMGFGDLNTSQWLALILGAVAGGGVTGGVTYSVKNGSSYDPSTSTPEPGHH